MGRRLLLLFIVFICLGPFLLRAAGPGDPPPGSLTGTVTDKSTGKPISGASIAIPDLRTGTVTDDDGRFSLSKLPSGSYLVQVSSIGYASYNIRVDLATTKAINVQLKPSTIEEAEVVVTGVSKATEMRRDPIPIVAVGKSYMQEHSAATNVIDAIANLPGISAVTTGPNISKPFIHGLGYNRVVTAVDGIRQEGQQWGDEHGIEVDQNSIDRIEIIKGPASLSYGSDAIAGVVNMLTPPPVPDGKTLGYVTGLYGTNNGQLNGSVRLQGNQNGFVWGVQASEKAAKNYRDRHDGWVYNTNFRETDARIMAGLNKGWGYSYLNASLFDDLQSIPDGSRDPATRAFTKQITDADTFRTVVPYSELNTYMVPTLHQLIQLYRVYDNSNIRLGKGNLLVNLGFQSSHRREYTHPQDGATPGLNLMLHSYTYDFRYSFVAGGYDLSGGVNGMYQDNALGYSSAFPIPAYHQFDIGPFVFVKKSYGKLDLSIGGRFDKRSFSGREAWVDTARPYYPVLYTGPNPESTQNVVRQFEALNKSFSGLTGSFGATYNVSEAFLVKGNVARGFRAPSIAELSANGPDPGSQIYHVGNSSFRPEFSMQYDLGLAVSLPYLQASIDLYDNEISNYLFQEAILDAGGNPERVNPDGTINPNGRYTRFTYVQTKARIEGGDFFLDIHPRPWLHFENTLALTYGTNAGDNGHAPDSIKYLPFIPPLHTHTELKGEYAKGFGRWKSAYVYMGFDHYNAQDRFFSAYGTETYTAGYNLWSAGVGVKLVNAAGKEIVQLNIEGTNLTNSNYQSNMSRLKYFDNASVPAGVQPGIFNMGRNIAFKVLVPFDLSKRSKS